MQQYETANITYKGLEDKGLTVTLIDDKKGKWSIWKKGYQTEEDSEPYASLQNFKFGDTFGVSYQSKEESFNDKKTGKAVKFMRRTIYSIMPTIAKPTSELKPQVKQTYESVKENTTDWDKIAVGKCQTVFLQAYIQSGKTLQEAKLQVVEARKLAELVVYGTQQPQDEAPLPEPIDQMAEELDF